jgi:hypothetical protein
MEVFLADVDEQVKRNEVKTTELSKVHSKGIIAFMVPSAIRIS